MKRFYHTTNPRYGEGIEDADRPYLFIDNLAQCCEIMNYLNEEKEHYKGIAEYMRVLMEENYEKKEDTLRILIVKYNDLYDRYIHLQNSTQNP